MNVKPLTESLSFQAMQAADLEQKQRKLTLATVNICLSDWSKHQLGSRSRINFVRFE
jgi:hypothetical protein